MGCVQGGVGWIQELEKKAESQEEKGSTIYNSFCTAMSGTELRGIQEF